MKSKYGDIKLNTKDYIAWDNIEIETSALPFKEHIFNSSIEDDITIPKFSKKYSKDDVFILTHDFFATLDKEIFKKFLSMFKVRSNNIIFTKKDLKDIEGFTTIKNGNIYITVNQKNTIEDVYTLVHEYGHALSMISNSEADKMHYYREIESKFLELLSCLYLMKIINEDETAKLINMYCVTNQNTSDQTLLKYQIYDFMNEENIFPYDNLLYKKLFQNLENKDKLNYEQFHMYLKYIYSNPFTYQASYAISDLYAYGLYDIYLTDPEKAFYLYKRILCKNNKSKEYLENIGIPISYGENVRKLIRKKDDNE